MCPESVSTQMSFFKNDILVSSTVRFLNCFCFPVVVKGWVRLLGPSGAEGYKCVDRLLQAGAGKSLSLCKGATYAHQIPGLRGMRH